MAADKAWKPDLPDHPLLGFTEKLADNTIRTQTDGGPAKLRRRFTSVPTEFEMEFALTEAQANTLITFYETDLLSGQRTFDGLNHPRLDDASVVWRFKEPPSVTCESKNLYRTTLKLEKLP